MNDIAVRVSQITKYFGKARPAAKNGNGRVIAVDHVSFDVARGEVFGVLGPNGSGKSTLIRLMATLLLPDEGVVLVFGHDAVREAMVVRRLINRVSVEASFFKKLSPMENLLYGARLYGLEAGRARREIRQILDRLGLQADSIGKPMEEMSRGMQQKVAIARALLSRPAMLLLDEPTTGLDPRSKLEVQAAVRELREQHGTTILLTTHDMAEADGLCDRLAIVDRGRLAALGTPATLKERIASGNGHATTLEDVFLGMTGKVFEDADVADGHRRAIASSFRSGLCRALRLDPLNREVRALSKQRECLKVRDVSITRLQASTPSWPNYFLVRPYWTWELV
jgi:ABC-2 type transport system ATP-binding protein